MKKNSRKLYTLKHNSVLDGKETIIPFTNSNGETSEKTTLTEIDAYTTSFENGFELTEALNSLGYRFFNSHFFIEYYYNHRRMKTDLIYSDQTVLREFALNNFGENCVKGDATFYRYLYSLIERAELEPELMRYLRSNNYMSSWLKQNIEEYNVYKEIDVELSHICMTRIKKELIKYKVIRDIEIGKKEYEKEKEFKQQMEERKKTFVKKKTKTGKTRHQTEGQGQLFDPDNY